MRRTLAVPVIILLGWVLAATAKPTENLDALKQRIEHASLPDQAKLSVKVAREQLQHVDDLYKAGDSQNARRALEDVASYGVRAANASAESRKHMKDTEIAVRELSYRLQNIERSVDVDEQATIKSAIQRIDKAHTDLLFRMFAK
jgi:hypothetical protein